MSEKVHFLNTLPGVSVCSVLSAFNSEIFTFPFDLVKTRLQIQGERAGKIGLGTPYAGMTRTAINIVRDEGLFKLWHGIEAIFLRQLIYSAIRLTTYVKLKDLVKSRKTDKQHFPLWQAMLSKLTTNNFGFLINLLRSQLVKYFIDHMRMNKYLI